MKIKDTLPDGWSPYAGDDNQPVNAVPTDADLHMNSLSTVVDYLTALPPSELVGYATELRTSIELLRAVLDEVLLPF